VSRLVWGQNPVRELLVAKSRDVSVVFVAAGDTGPAIKQIRDMCSQKRIIVEERERAELDSLCGEPQARHQGVIAVAGELKYLEIEDVLDAIEGKPSLLVVLDSVQDPHNLGAIIRSASVFGADAVIIPRDRAVSVTPVVVKSSAGATEHMPICKVTNLARTLEQLKAAGVWTVAAVADDAQEPWQIDLTGSIAIVMGAEGKGLRPLVAKGCDFRARIPMAGQVASLNVSVATGALLYEAVRQRSGKR
jgi:23S rRNA (guanosine2251-2'-O)-methyltransferase